MASKIVAKDEIGSVFSLTGFAESLMPLMTAPLVTALFNATLNIDPGIVYYCLTGLNVLAMPICLYLDLLWRQTPSLQQS